MSSLCTIFSLYIRQVAKELMGVPAEMQVEYMDDTLKNNLKDKHMVEILESIFFKSQAEAEAIMLKVHHEEKAIAAFPAVKLQLADGSI